MSESITIADIYKLFEQTNAALERSREEFDRSMAESRAEADRRAAEADRRAAELDRRAAEAALRSAEADRRLAKLEKTVERTAKSVDSLTTRWGRFVEELVEPAVLKLFRAKGIDVKEVHPRIKTKRQGLAMEIDIMAVDDTELVLVECKSRLSKDDVDDFLIKLSRFKLAFPHYQNYTVYGAVAGIEINEGIDRYSYQKGLFVIKPSGDVVVIANNRDFVPSRW